MVSEALTAKERKQLKKILEPYGMVTRVANFAKVHRSTIYRVLVGHRIDEDAVFLLRTFILIHIPTKTK